MWRFRCDTKFKRSLVTFSSRVSSHTEPCYSRAWFFLSMKTSQLSKGQSRSIGRAMCDYQMLTDGDRVLVAVSGGLDSSVLAWVLQEWRKRAPIHYTIKCVHIDNGFTDAGSSSSPVAVLTKMMEEYEIDFSVIPEKTLDERTCFLCARNRRAQLFDLAKSWNMNKIALGHHMDDLVETLYLNMIYSGNLSTMVPRQELFGGELAIIRPLAYLEKDEVASLASTLGITAAANLCPVEKESRRDTVKQILAGIYRKEPDAKKSIFRAMGNVRKGYMLGGIKTE